MPSVGDDGTLASFGGKRFDISHRYQLPKLQFAPFPMPDRRPKNDRTALTTEYPCAEDHGGRREAHCELHGQGDVGVSPIIPADATVVRGTVTSRSEIPETGQICRLQRPIPTSYDWRRPARRWSYTVPPTDLNVPFHEKDDAKRLGARWDAARKTWFLPDYTDAAPFEKWLPLQPGINIRCRSYFIAQSARACWHCERNSHVFSFLLPRGHQTWQDDDARAGWETQNNEAIIYYITWIPEFVQVQMRCMTSHYRSDFSKTIQSFYWMNHCEHCGMKQGDFELFEEFDTPFCPIRTEDACRILLLPVKEAFEASAASIAYEPGFFEGMRIGPVAARS